MRGIHLTIALLFIIFGFQAQSKSNECDELTKLLEQGKYKRAYRLLIVAGEYSCGVLRYAQVLKYNGRYEEALKILQGENNDEARELRLELERNLGLTRPDELYAVLPYGDSDSTSSQIFAALQSPILSKTQKILISAFPRKIYEGKTVFEIVDDESSFFTELKNEFEERQRVYNIDLGSGWISKDSLLYYGAYYKVPLSIGGFHDDFAIYRWDGKKHELVGRPGKNNAFMHPTLTNDGWMIFTSNREGGFGGMDLWKINLNNTSGEPINLGADINSKYNEIYPAEAGDSLYFVTDHPKKSIGGYDVLLHYNGKISNPGKPLNSESDELNPYTVNRDLAFLVTDRLYPDSLDLLVKVKPFKSRLLFDLIHGEVDSQGEMTGEKVELLDSEGSVLDYTYVNSEGRFTFAGIKGLEDYTISFDKGKISGGEKVFLFNKNFGLVEEMELDSSGQANFELLTPEDYFLEKVVNQDESMLSIDIAGMLSASGNKNIQGVEIFLQDSEGRTIARAFTNEKGEFEFEQVKPDEKYSFKSAVIDLSSELRIFNQDGEVIETIKPGSEGDFVYVRLKETDKIITITNEERVKVKVAPEEKFNLPTIYFELDRTELNSDARETLNKLTSILVDNPHVGIRLASHTDSKGSAAYNLVLSQKRIESVKDYLGQQNIDADRVSGLGYGETRLVNECDDSVECTEEQHAENRRIEIQFYSKD